MLLIQRFYLFINSGGFEKLQFLLLLFYSDFVGSYSRK